MKAMHFALNTQQETANHGIFSIEPLENGFGHTLGNALRRVLLGSFRGAAITAVKVAGVTHKFSTLEGLSEDMVDLMLNLKTVKVAYTGDEPVTAKLSVKGPKVVTAKDIVAPATVKVINSDAVIANVSSGTKLELELTIETGYGYSPAEERPSSTLGILSLDAIFSPVERVSYQVAATRVGRRTDYDKLVIDITTDGATSPSDALKSAAEVLVAAFSQIINPTLPDEQVASSLGTSSVVGIDELGLPTRVSNALKNAGYNSAQELIKATNKDLKNVKNLGGKSVDLLDEALTSKGLTRVK
ncbi:MAG: DNA-directed RNA polymerase subunit alpha [Microgenomates group bacterium GW2011_GWC1_46_16]|uniref:DNA-directed RNA polymerase subunit alpha n=2 Tax=Candidatus Collieribacteriota TaxID=1752725 RepID=A0A1F5FXE1_9BACT|nr:MAG: DNA-directed RNA polymerase subunit alpha [Microgenomates group bacterium GW2011_GWF1_46_12]KKU26870.1 MAG: DNA-directed RNA polymerase subunit alpha [Microgenomates group bacterium GW2011_GWC1_46_16]KKU28286.1 MAG: DNA-directed RNA polymerase subunit alpha [Microgenomates group bacterium GW2011_GWF2_46_18]KKU44131.1 MAG: DNA-directed RNA polymerase subunit alpha [Microgenomates group bacterium GW2011_GWA1_46_7]KKU45509.1 MAG: DNA-directed RNA polymerase subunit alpha [Microgenomates gr